MSVYVLKDGKISLATGTQPKDALLFAPSGKSSSQVIKEDRAAWKVSNSLIQQRFKEATKR